MISLQGFQKMKRFDMFIKSNNLFLRNSSFASQQIRPSSSLMTSRLRMTSAPCINSPNGMLLSKVPTNWSVSVQRAGAASAQGDHVKLWIFERIVALSIPLLIPVALMLENPFVDGALAVLIVMHTHWGLDAIIIDYARPIVVGPLLPKVAHLMLNVLSVVTLAGLFMLIYNGPGLATAIKNFWAIGKEKEEKTE